ncbi:hypothetical protein KIPB_002433 [Kipferlia bialata]|uniref:protein-synthesizing GTPase n=1 Tax=Kipferlia bialata TaxID=797122 RepID=A0A9K3CS93_9EUKA|nr:hypothetical protein KIPB_002433 [Kipferlia bialata]|eukprot:g2433.t1
MLKPAHLVQQRVDMPIEEMHPLHPDVISRQATINIGTIGHVAHGKSTVVKAITGVQTVRFNAELKRNITIKLGYANAKLYKCTVCPAPSAYCAFGSNKEDSPRCPSCQNEMVLQRHVSFVDCPGHDILMATMLTGAAVMDAALLLIAANEPCPQPQTREHLAAVDIVKLEQIIVLQNKIDLVSEAAAIQQHEDIKAFMQLAINKDFPVLPVSAQLGYNIDVVVEYLCRAIRVPRRDFTLPPIFVIIRSFDVNKPGTTPEELKGGIAGGSLLQGLMRLGDEIEIKPGVIHRLKNGTFRCRPLLTRVVTLQAEQNELSFAVPGGLIGMGLLVDPTLTRKDRLVGHLAGRPKCLPQIYTTIYVKYQLMRMLVGKKSAAGASSQVCTQRECGVYMRHRNAYNPPPLSLSLPLSHP